MGKTSKPCSILVLDQDLYDSPEAQALQQKGHIIHPPSDVLALYDVVIGPKCSFIDPALGDLEGQLTMLLARVRGVKYAKQGKG